MKYYPNEKEQKYIILLPRANNNSRISSFLNITFKNRLRDIISITLSTVWNISIRNIKY